MDGLSDIPLTTPVPLFSTAHFFNSKIQSFVKTSIKKNLHSIFALAVLVQHSKLWKISLKK